MASFRVLLLLIALFVSTVSAQSTVLIFADFTSSATSLSQDNFKKGLENHLDFLKVNQTTLDIQDTKGNVLDALVALDVRLRANPSIKVIIVADNEAVTQSIQGILSRKVEWSSILLISAFASSSTVCDIVANPNTVCVMPSAITTLTAIFEASSLYFHWSSVAVIMSNDEHGRSVATILDKVASSVTGSPAIVSRQYIPTGTKASDSADDAVLAATIQGRPVAVLLFVTPAEYTRILAAQKRNSAASKLFFLLSRTNVNVVKTFAGNVESKTPMPGGVFVPYYAQASTFGLDNSKTDEMGRLLLSYTADSLNVALRASALNPTSIFNQTFTQGVTSKNGDFSFDKNNGRRTYVLLGLASRDYDPLLSYMLKPTSASPIWEGSMNTINALVPASPLRAVTVCMAAPPECSDVANLARLLSYTFQLNAEGSTSTSIVPVPINTGIDGVSGLASFIEVAKQCSILTGPGRFAINNVYTPIINNYGITQIDYTTANPALSDDVAYPYFNRVIPSDTFNLKVLAATMDYFAWERVILLTTADTYGTAMAKAAVDAMDERAILVEQLYTLESITAAALVPFFTKLKDSFIGRVVIPLLPVSDEQAAIFIDTWASMNDKTTIFLFSSIFCQYLHSRPAQRLRVPSSICAIPTYNQTLVDSTKAAYDSSLPRVRTTLFDAGFENVDKCDLDAWGPYSVTALDAAKMLRQIVVNASTTGVVINTTNMMPMIRGVTFNGITAPFTITSAGDRTSAEYNLDIQMAGTDNNVTVFGYWDSRNTPNFRYLLANKNSITWMDGTNKFPAATIRSLTFIAQTTLTASPGTIVLSVVGFLGTFLVFGFCYRHYRTQRMLEVDFDRMVEDLDRAQKRKREEAEASV